MKVRDISYYLVLFIFFEIVAASSAYAYLDSGTGSMLLQLLLGGVAGLIVIIKIYWHRILSILNIKNKDED